MESDVQNFIAGEENEKPKVTYSVALLWHFSRLRTKIDAW